MTDGFRSRASAWPAQGAQRKFGNIRPEPPAMTELTDLSVASGRERRSGASRVPVRHRYFGWSEHGVSSGQETAEVSSLS